MPNPSPLPGQAYKSLRSTLRYFLAAGFSVLLGSLLVPRIALAQSTTPTATVAVDATKIVGPVSSYVFGQSMEAADSAGIFKDSVTAPSELETGNGFWNPEAKRPVPALIDRCRQLGVGMMRYPGGSLVNNFDWRKAVGPVESRGLWKFGVDEYITVCRAMGAEPLIEVSDYVLPADQMPAHNAQFVEYLNAPATPEHPWAERRKKWGHPEPYGVKYFELGNESSGGNAGVVPHRQYTAEQYAQYAIACAHSMKAVDPSIQVGIVTSIGVEDPFCDWNKTVVGKAGSIADFVVVHEYAPSIGPNMPVEMEDQLMQACMAEGDQYEKMLQDYRQMIREAAHKDLPMAITEFNAGFETEKPKPYRFSYGAALECADLLRIFLKPENGVSIANYWQLSNGYWGMIQTELSVPDGGKVTEHAAVPLFRLWGEHFGKTLVAAKVDGPTAAFAGMSSVLPTKGNSYQKATDLGPTAFETVNRPTFAGNGFAGKWTGPDSLEIKLSDFVNDAYPQLGTVKPFPDKAITDCDYQFSFDARYKPAPGTVTRNLGLEIGDDRGWPATGNIAQVGGVTQPDWKSFHSQTLHTLATAKGISFNAMLGAEKEKLSGLFEVRNLKIEAIGQTTFPEYALLTCSASLSEDGNKLYLIVFNKSADEVIPTTLSVAGFPASEGKIWQVTGPRLASLDQVSETVSGDKLPVTNGNLSYAFPAHSMTAIEIDKSAAP